MSGAAGGQQQMKQGCSDLSHLGSGVSSSAQVDHGQSRTDAQGGEEDIPSGIRLTHCPEQLQGKLCVWTVDGSHVLLLQSKEKQHQKDVKAGICNL